MADCFSVAAGRLTLFMCQGAMLSGLGILPPLENTIVLPFQNFALQPRLGTAGVGQLDGLGKLACGDELVDLRALKADVLWQVGEADQFVERLHEILLSSLSAGERCRLVTKGSLYWTEKDAAYFETGFFPFKYE